MQTLDCGRAFNLRLTNPTQSHKSQALNHVEEVLLLHVLWITLLFPCPRSQQHPKLHSYMDKQLDLEVTMRDKMREMSSAEFEGTNV